MKTTKWLRNRSKCIKCKTDSLPHYSKGFCRKCYKQQWRSKNKDHISKYNLKYRTAKKINADLFLAYYSLQTNKGENHE